MSDYWNKHQQLNLYKNKQYTVIVYNIILHSIISPQCISMYMQYKNFIAALTTGNVANAVT